MAAPFVRTSTGDGFALSSAIPEFRFFGFDAGATIGEYAQSGCIDSPGGARVIRPELGLRYEISLLRMMLN
jgi:hypothetical protein